jgi:predicted phosphodiesterase
MGYSYAVCGGDVVTGCYDNKQDAVKEIKDFYSQFSVPILSIQGNHDANKNDNPNKSAQLSEKEVNRLMYTHNPPGTHMSHGGDFAYIDDSAHRVRYIIFHYDETDAVADTVLDSIDQAVCELSSDWSVVLFSHAYWHYSRPGGTLSPKPEGKRLADALLDIQRRSQATIVLWHVGHIHRDKYELLSDGHGNRILVVATNCDAYQRSACWGGLSMTKGTATEQVIDIVQIDKAAGKVYMTRIGAGKSRSYAIG